ncbi:Thioredoxin domain-containing protein [Aphelenchoides besseyi]|nr:Thioredoxin domain-containing protein [Aphelenchoides besseyi]
MIRSSLFVALTVTLFVWANAADEKKTNINAIFENPLANGYGDDINWVKWEDAIETALDLKKPIFLLIHKNWCHACKTLKKSMQQSHARKAFKKLSEYFVMVNTPDDEEPYEEEYRPDGKYIPRLLFLDMNGDHLVDIKNKKAEYKNYAYYYSTPADILNSMKDVLRYFDIEVPEIKRGDSLKPKKPARKESDGPEPPKKQKDEKKVEEPKTEQKPKTDAKSAKEEKPTKEEKKSEL